jgi:hypothetical protein
MLPGGRGGAVPLIGTVEAVEKVPKQILGRDAEKSDLIECAATSDLVLRRRASDPRKHRSRSSKGLFLQAR